MRESEITVRLFFWIFNKSDFLIQTSFTRFSRTKKLKKKKTFQRELELYSCAVEFEMIIACQRTKVDRLLLQ